MTQIDKRVYAAVGITKDATGVVKVRYSGEEYATRVKMYMAQGCTEVEFRELEIPLTKIQACEWLLNQQFVDENTEFVAAVKLEMGKKIALVEPQEPKKRGRPASPEVAARRAKEAVEKAARKAVRDEKAAEKAAIIAKAKMTSQKVQNVVKTSIESTENLIDSEELQEFERLAQA